MVLSFAGFILLGALVLWLPWSQAGKPLAFVDTLFTSTSAVCVTGLTVVDTEKDFSLFGQTVIAILIQVGGLGVITFAVLFFRALGRRLSLSSQVILQESFLQREAAQEIKLVFRRVFVQTSVIELTGALLLFLTLLPLHPWSRALTSAFFHSVSAFCNAGFSIYSDNLVGLSGHWFLLLIIAALIVAGGLGQTVLTELGPLLWKRLKRRRQEHIPLLSLNAKVVVRTSAWLIVLGALGLLVFGMTPAEETLHAKVSGALFQSVSSRTAGFNSIDIGGLPQASLLWLVLLMFIGGSPGSCAGGIKTTTLVIWFASIKARLLKKPEVQLLGYHLPDDLIHQAEVLMGLAVWWNLLGVFFLLSTEKSPTMLQLLFEQVSAFGTVGLSTGITAALSDAGKLWLSLTMLVGRLGPLTVTTWILTTVWPRVRYPEGRLMIG